MFLICTLLLSILLYLYGTRKFTYWSSRGVKHDAPLPFFGNNLKSYCLLESFSDFVADTYNKYPDEPYVGFYAGETSYLLLKDPALIRQILEADFSHFYPRLYRSRPDELPEPMLNNIFFNHGDLWKLLRQRMTPAFTTGKLKAMFPLIREKGDRLQVIASKCAMENRVVDVKELLSRFTTDFIGASNFGIDIDSLNDEGSQFRVLGKRMFQLSLKNALTVILKQRWPRLFKNWHLVNGKMKRDMLSILEERGYKPSGRNDMVDLLLEMRAKGTMVGNSIEHRNADGTPQVTEVEFSDELIASHIILFFGAGFETAATSASFTLHQLAHHPEAQKKCQEEIDRVLKKYDGQICYESVKEMKYLEMAFLEGLRMYPPLGFLIRKCAKTYTLPGTDITLDKGVAVMVSLQALHNDEKYFENPTQFIPERFAPDRIRDIPKHVYLPFGTGPRVCIGERLAYAQSLSALASILRVCSVARASPNAQKHVVPEPATYIVQTPRGGLPLRFVKRTS